MKASVCSAAGRIRQVALLFGIGFCCLLFVSAGLARAQTAATIESLQQQIEALKRSSDEQINALKQQIEALKATQEAQAAQVAKAAPPAAAAPAQAPTEPGTGKTMFANTDVRVTLGGYIAMTGIYRDRYTGSDSNSKWNIGSGGLPLPNSPNYYMDELRGSARATRLSLLAQGQEDYAALSAYTEIDFLGGAATSSANSQGTNGYYPRLRQAWAGYDTTTSGWHLCRPGLHPPHSKQGGHSRAPGSLAHGRRQHVCPRFYLHAEPAGAPRQELRKRRMGGYVA